jgi:hypothetical protein
MALTKTLRWRGEAMPMGPVGHPAPPVRHPAPTARRKEESVHIHIHDQRIDGSGPELRSPRGTRQGVIGAQEAGGWREAGAELVTRLEGGLTDYYIDNIPGDDTGVGLYRVRQTEERTEPGARRMSQSSSPSSKTGDKTLRMLVNREVSQYRRLREIAAANREFWSQPENQGRS